MAEDWYLLGFTPEEITEAYQDARLAELCATAVGAPPPGFAVLAAAATGGPHLVHWFVSPEAAAALDGAGVPWRTFLVGRCAGPPESAYPAIKMK